MRSLYLLALIALLVQSCSHSSEVLSGKKFQKRKYCSGWYVEHHGERSKTLKSSDAGKNNKEPVVSTSQNQPQAKTNDLISDKDHNEESISSSTNNEGNTFKKENITQKKTREENARSKSESLGEKKKKRKEKWEPITIWASSSSCLGTWFTGWPIHLLYVCLPLYALGIALAVVGLIKLKKSKKRNRKKCIIIIIGSILLILLALSYGAL